MADALVEAARRGMPPASAAAKLGVDDSTVRRWLQMGRDELTQWHSGQAIAQETIAACRALYARIRQASAECEAEMLESVREAANTVGRSGVREWRAATWWLNNSPATRQIYHEHKEVEVNHGGQVGVEHRLVRQMSDAQLIELAGPEIAGLIEAPAHIDNVG
jgi:hypothetical protein